jgi:IS6 family transposase
MAADQDGALFRGRHFASEVILWALRWYLAFPISYRDLALMLSDRGVTVDHTTLFRWIQAYAATLEQRIRRHLRPCTGSWRVDETYIKVKGAWTYLYRAVDSLGQTIDLLLAVRRDAAAAKRFFRKALAQPHTVNPRTITVDKNPAYPRAATQMKRTCELWRFARLRQCKYLNNIVEQDHRRIKRLVRPGLGFASLPHRQTNTGRLRGDGNDQEGAGSQHQRPGHAGPERLRCRRLQDRRLNPPPPTLCASRICVCNRTQPFTLHRIPDARQLWRA